MPYPSEASCSLKDPDGFQKDSFRRIKRGTLGIIIGRPKGQETTTAQAYRYPTTDWTESEAKAHCKEAGGTFHAASPKKKEAGLWDISGTEDLEEGRDKMADEISLDSIRSALYDYLRPPSAELPKVDSSFYVKDVYTDHAVVEGKGKLWKVPFTMGDEGIEFGEMEEVRIEYVPVKALKALFGKVLDFFRPAEGEKAKWTTAYINKLPDSAFLYIETGGTKDEDGKTVPRSLRHFPVKSAEGNFDIFHVRNAISRAPQAKDKEGNSLSDAIVARVQAKARGILESLRKMMPQGFSGFKVYTQEDDRLRWVSWTSNAFADREGEIFTTKSLEDYAVRAMTEGKHGALWIGHFPVKVGTPDSHIVFGRFLVESGLFDDTPQGKKAEAYLAACEQPLEMSHGYHYVKKDREDKVYEWVDIIERSVLPAGTAANLWTSMATIVQEVKAMGMSPEVEKLVKDVLGEDIFNQLKGDTEGLTKALEAAGVDFKALETAEPVKVEEPAVKIEIEIPADIKAAFAQASKDFVALQTKVEGDIAGIRKSVDELTAKVTALAVTDAEKIAQKAKDETPRNVLWRASQDDGTKVTKEQESKITPPAIPTAVQQMAARVGGA